MHSKRRYYTAYVAMACSEMDADCNAEKREIDIVTKSEGKRT